MSSGAVPAPSVAPETRGVRAVVAGVAGFFGATGILAAVGFLVHHAFFLLVGLPYPPFSTIDYLRVSGVFLFDVFVLVILLYGTMAIIFLGLAMLIVTTIVVLLPSSPPLSWREFRGRSGVMWRSLANWYTRVCHGDVALIVGLLGLILFTLYYHYPVFAQRYVTTAPESCGDPRSAPLELETVWRLIDCRRSDIREIILSQDGLPEAQAIYRNGVLWLLVLTLCVAHNLYKQFGSPEWARSLVRRWAWCLAAALLFLSFAYFPGGYAVLFLDKQAPLVHVTFKTERTAVTAGSAKSESPRPNVATWQDTVMDRSWHLLFQNEKEVWLFRWPTALILQKDQLGLVEIGRRQWIFPTQ